MLDRLCRVVPGSNTRPVHRIVPQNLIDYSVYLSGSNREKRAEALIYSACAREQIVVYALDPVRKEAMKLETRVPTRG